MKTFELSTMAREHASLDNRMGLSAKALLYNARWFTHIRWLIVAVFGLAGALGCLMPEHVLVKVRLVPPCRVSFVLAGLLVIDNLVLMGLQRRLTPASSSAIKANIWAQIVIDLAVLTYYVHLVGYTSFVAFTYLFHITLACIFFSSAGSFVVTCVAALFYAYSLCPCWDGGGSVFVPCDPVTKNLEYLHAAGTVGIWYVVWYLVSTLSAGVRARDARLESANVQLQESDREKNRLVIQTAHDLKSPFSGIESSIELLRYKHWNDLDEPVRKIIDKIEVRSRTLSARIKDILQLGALRLESGSAAGGMGCTELKSLLDNVINEIREKAGSRKVSIKLRADETTVVGGGQELHMLFANLVSNAVSYSREGGQVDIVADKTDEYVTVSVIDQGIGIREDALPHIFDEYFRTREGAEFNEQSTGLGLSIVKEVATKLGLRIQVASGINEGSRFDVRLRVADAQPSVVQ